MKKLKQILSNKNTVTFIGIILMVLVLYLFYNWKVSQATSPIRVPYAAQTIAPRTKITKEMINYAEISQSSMKGNVLTNENTQILGMYTKVNVTIPSGSLFYAQQLIQEVELADYYLEELGPEDVAYSFSVDVESTYGNSMYPGNYIDIYYRGKGDDGLIMVGKLVENVKILAVKDSAGRAVFESVNDDRTPNQIIVGVSREINLLLRAAEDIPKAKIILVPTNISLSEEDDEIVANVTSEKIKAYINSQASLLEDDKLNNENQDSTINTDQTDTEQDTENKDETE